MVCMLLHMVCNPEYPFTQVDQKFMLSGHSYLPNDRYFGNIESARRKALHIYVPEHWYDLIRTARCENPFAVTVMENEDFVDIKTLKKAIVNRKKDTARNPVDWLSMRWIQLRKEKPLEFHDCYSHD